ncbi:neuraminidase-like domain-containing protein [Pseudomonas asplenii]|uniref:Tc toxin subunit A-related protein n=1 Tax=Pseudomonas asplenii TaxID=53407 RepID=UPI0006CCE449|nr:neuraminidase-like domain-containing protein [Pseudomonas fuscovaginae]KPA95917.1 virulence plasmid 28 protein [Pseudomonas fuscovaginae]
MKTTDSALADFYAKNPDFDLENFDFIAQDSARLRNKRNKAKSLPLKIEKALRAYQRLLRLSGSQNVAQWLCTQGFTSAHHIAAVPRSAFIAQVASHLGDEFSAQLHERASHVKHQVTHVWANLVASRPQSATTRSRASTVTEDTLAELQALPSYAAMFGNQNFCTCEDCKSIFGPAAYYVDIMRITDAYVSQVNKATIPAAYQLAVRRNDLFTLPLSCATTNDTLAYLAIANQVLNDKLLVETKQADIPWLLATTTYPFNTPFNPRLMQVNLTLQAMDLSLAALYASTSDFPSADPHALALALMGVSQEQAAFVGSPLVTDAQLKVAWGLRSNKSLDSLSELAVFSKRSGLSRADVVELTRQGMTPAELGGGLAHTLWFNRTLPAGESVQIHLGDDSPDTLSNLTSATQDALNRYIRLARWSGLGFTDLGYGLRSLDLELLDAATLDTLAMARGVVQSLGWTWAQASALWADMPTTGSGGAAGTASLFDQVWNNPAVLASDGRAYHPLYSDNPLYQDPVATWDVAAGTTTLSGFDVARLRAGLRVSSPDLQALAAIAFPGTDKVALSVGNLSTLYRLASLAQVMGLGVDELQATAAWAEVDVTTPIAPQAVARWLLIPGWLEQCHLSVNQVQAFLDPSLPEVADDISQISHEAMLSIWTQAQGSLFTAGALTGTTIDTERAAEMYEAILSLGKPVAVEVGDAYRAHVPNAPELDMALVPLPVTAAELASLGFSAEETQVVVQTLNRFHLSQGQVLNSGLATLAGVTAELIGALGAMVSAQPGRIAWITCLLTPSADGDSTWKLSRQALQDMARLLLVCQALPLEVPVITAMVDRPLVFGLKLEALFSLDTLQAMSIYLQSRQRLGLTDASYLAYLSIPADTTCTGGQKAAALCVLTGWSQQDLCGVLSALKATDLLYDYTAGLWRLATIFSLLQRAGFGATAYQSLLDSRQWALSGSDGAKHWQAWEQLVNAVDGAAAAHFKLAWAEISPGIQAQLLEARRDVLVPSLLWYYEVSQPQIVSVNDLSGYLLIDVQMGGSNQTSRVVLAMASVQMYLNRVRANMEPGIAQLPIPEVWWQWLTTYRMWEANRRVFLYPENYLDPTLRSSRTSLFLQLESDLLQTNITPPRVEEVYRNYVQGLERYASLQFVDAFRGTISDPRRGEIDTLYVFARSATEPYAYYWAKQEHEANWSEWTAIDVTIKSPYVTPVYAFGRLFVFWVETSVVSSTAIETPSAGNTHSSNSVVYKAAIRYSFMDANGTWIGDQTLAAEQVIFATPSDVHLSSQSGYELFNINSLFWQKCNVLLFAGTAPIGPENDVRIDEKIAVLYGPFLENSSNGTPIDIPTVPPLSGQVNPAVTQFEMDVYRRSRIVNQAIGSGFRGVIGLREPLLLNRELLKDYLFQRTEFLNLADNYSTGVPPTVQPLYDYAMNRLYVRPTLNLFRSNYYGDWNNTIETALLRRPMTAAWIAFGGLNAVGAQQLINDLLGAGYLKNGSGAGKYVVLPGFNNNADFRFLFDGDEGRDVQIIRQWAKHCLLQASIEQREVQVATFLMTELSLGAGEQALKDLRAAGILDAEDYVRPSFNSATDLSQILDGAPDHASVEFVIRLELFAAMGDTVLFARLSNRQCSTFVIKNQPSHFVGNVNSESFLVTPDTSRSPPLNDRSRAIGLTTTQSVTKLSFVGSHITPKESEEVFALLVQHKVIDSNGRLPEPFQSTDDLSYLFPAEPAPSRQIKTAQVRVVLVDLPTMTLVSYYAEDDEIIITAQSFFRMGISQSQAKQVFDTLVARRVIGPQGYISSRYDPVRDLVDLFPGEPASKAALLTAEVALIMNRYYDNTWRRDVHDLYYRFTRMTTGAVPKLSAALQQGGVPALLSLHQQQAPILATTPFSSYAPGERVRPPALSDATQVDFNGVYGLYYWELFFFTPRLIADALFQAGDFQGALGWLQYIFNPSERLTSLSPADFQTPDISAAQANDAFNLLKNHGVITDQNQVSTDYTNRTGLDYLFPDVDDPVLRTRMIEQVRAVLFNHQTASLAGQFWRFQPFRNHTQQSMVQTLTSPVQIAVYNSDPYDPYAIAQLRIGAFERATFCSYIDLLVAWGDSFFQRKTREYLNAAYLLYVMASDLLGQRPESVGPCTDQLPVTFNQILERYGNDPDAIPQFLLDMENLLAVRGTAPTSALSMAGGAFNEIDALFCVPQNEMLLARWDAVEDRLYKIRNNLDLDGNPLLLPLFAAPIDPMALVRAAAANGSGGGFAELAVREPTAQTLRFSTLLTNARSVVGDLQVLGGELEQALSGQSSEALMLLQSTHEQQLLSAQLLSFEQRVKGAQATLDAVQATRAMTVQRKQYYDDLVSDGMIAAEILSITLGIASRVCGFVAIGFETGAAIAALTPQVGSPFAMTYGGLQIEGSLHRTSGMWRQTAEVMDTAKDLSDAIGQYQRLKAGWQQEATQAGLELTQIDQQILNARADLASSKADYASYQINLKNTQAQQAFLQSKFDNPDYYAWRVSRATALYYQTYQLALQSVNAAQSALQWALGDTTAYLTSDPWDPARRGLMAGASLNLVLDRMDYAFSQKDVLHQEITCNVYLSQLNPAQLIRLRAEGVADFSLTEALFDFDFPSHYCRRIKAISVALLGEEGALPVNVHANITQTANKILREPTAKGLQYMLDGTGNPGGDVWVDWRANQSVSLSRSEADEGAFVEYYMDGEKLQRFEGTGAVSNWHYQLPKNTNQFDFSQIEDVQLKLRYTATDGGKTWRDKVEKALVGQTYSTALMISLASAQPEAWTAFLEDTSDPLRQTLTFDVPAEIFPPNTTGLVVEKAYLALVVASGITLPASSSFLRLRAGQQPEQPVTTVGLAGQVAYTKVPLKQIAGVWKVLFDLQTMKSNPALAVLLNSKGRVNGEALLNLFVSVQFTATVFK